MPPRWAGGATNVSVCSGAAFLVPPGPPSPDSYEATSAPHSQSEKNIFDQLRVVNTFSVRRNRSNHRFVVNPAFSASSHGRHYSPCGNNLGCPNNIVHLFSMSKSFGLAGWRVGYAVYPAWASEEMVKVQDTLPTHACTASQKIALAALEGRPVSAPLAVHRCKS